MDGRPVPNSVMAEGDGPGTGRAPSRAVALPDWRSAACAMGIILGGADCAPAAAQDMSWAGDVREDGWGDGRVTSGADMVIFRRPAPKGPEGRPRLQLRYEYRDGVRIGGKTYLSMLALDEYDCQGGRFRSLRMAAFTRHNAEGESRQGPGGTGPWATPSPDTVDAKSLAAACAGQ